MSSLPFTPFHPSRPSTNETIAEVGDVLRSGWITTGPKVQGARSALSRVLGRPAGAAGQLATAAMELAPAAVRHRPGRRGHHPAADWVATANVVLRSGRKAGVRRCRCEHPQHRSRPDGSAPSRPDACAACRWTWPAWPWTGPAERGGAEAQAARGRGRGAIHRLPQGRPRDRQLRRHRVVQLPRQQELHDLRRRLPGPEQRRRGAALRKACASTA